MTACRHCLRVLQQYTSVVEAHFEVGRTHQTLSNPLLFTDLLVPAQCTFPYTHYILILLKVCVAHYLCDSHVYNDGTPLPSVPRSLRPDYLHAHYTVQNRMNWMHCFVGPLHCKAGDLVRFNIDFLIPFHLKFHFSHNPTSYHECMYTGGMESINVHFVDHKGWKG